MQDYSHIRGFNYQPSYAATLQAQWLYFDRAVWEREVAWSKRFATNTLRIWLDWHAFIQMGDELLNRLDQALDVLAKNNIKAMVVQFNRWVDWKFPAGGISDNDLWHSDWAFSKFLPYVDRLAARFGQDERIIMWDICNEPSQCSPPSEVMPLREQVWLTTMCDMLRKRSAILITIGTMTGDFVKRLAGVVDVLSFHPYPHTISEMEICCQEHLSIAKAFRKPLICTETCCGSFNDHERGALAKGTLQTLEQNKIGWIAWMLCEGKIISGNRERVDDNAMRPAEGYMAFILKDGRTRDGHEWLEQ